MRVLILGLLVACSNASRGEQAFEPASHSVRGDDVQVELLGAYYQERQLTVRVAVSNRAKEALAIGHAGVLLAYEELEFPAAQSGGNIGVPPGDRVELLVQFDTGTPVVARSYLRLRALERGGEPLDALTLPIPAPRS